MMNFSGAVEAISLVALGSLLVYTLALVRMGRLSAHLVVSWIVAQLAAIVAILAWGRLPVIALTSALGDRELLVVLAVLSFSFIAYLMLDSLQRISQQSAQIARLTQELALLREESRRPAATTPLAQTPPASADRAHASRRSSVSPLTELVLALWVIGCVLLYVVQGYWALPARLHHLLLAAYKQ